MRALLVNVLMNSLLSGRREMKSQTDCTWMAAGKFYMLKAQPLICYSTFLTSHLFWYLLKLCDCQLGIVLTIKTLWILTSRMKQNWGWGTWPLPWVVWTLWGNYSVWISTKWHVIQLQFLQNPGLQQVAWLRGHLWGRINRSLSKQSLTVTMARKWITFAETGECTQWENQAEP